MRLKIKNIVAIFLLLLIVGAFSSCSTRRRIFKAPIKKEGAKYLFSQLKDHELRFETFSSKFSVHYAQGNKKISFNGHIRIQKDSTIWVSISPILGIEMARIMITPDSVKVINRANKTYYEENFNFVTDYLNSAMDFDMMQAFLMGNDFTFYEKGNWKTSLDGNYYKLVTANRRKLKKYVENSEKINIPIQNTWLDPFTFKIMKVMVKEINRQHSKKLTATYDNFFVVDQQMMPLHIEFEIKAEDKMNIYIDYSRVALDKELRFPFGISSKYKKISLK